MILLVSREGVAKDWCHKNKFFKEFVMTILASTRVFKKNNITSILSFLTFFL